MSEFADRAAAISLKSTMGFMPTCGGRVKRNVRRPLPFASMIPEHRILKIRRRRKR